MSVNNLSRRPKRNREPLGPAVAPEPIPAARNVAERTASDAASTTAGALENKIHIQPYTGTTYYQSVSSDGLFIEEYGDEITTIDADGAGTTNIWVEPDPSA